MPYVVYATEYFQDIFDALDGNEQQWIEGIKEQLQQSIVPTGKILRFSWFREKKFLNKRLYFLMDESTKRILFVSFAPKNEQQRVIALVLRQKDDLLSYLRRL
jgi:hypothetical protein